MFLCLTKVDKSAETRRTLHTHTHTHTHTCSLLLSLLSIFIFCPHVVFGADVDVTNEIQYKEQLVRELKEEIAQIDAEKIRCEKAKKSWGAATVVGGVGVAATGIAAIVQGVKINQQKKEKTEEKK